MTPQGWPSKAAPVLRWLERHREPYTGGADLLAKATGLTPREVGHVLARLERLRVSREARNGHGNASARWRVEMLPPKGRNRPRDKVDPGHG